MVQKNLGPARPLHWPTRVTIGIGAYQKRSATHQAVGTDLLVIQDIDRGQSPDLGPHLDLDHDQEPDDHTKIDIDLVPAHEILILVKVRI